MRFFYPALAFLLLFLVFVPLAAAEANFACTGELGEAKSAGLLELVEKRYGDISSVSASFVQRSYFAGLDRSESSKGTVLFKSPGKMHWQYEHPNKQLFVADGRTLWFYQQEENQVTIGDFEESFRSDLPVSFLLGAGELKKSFNLKSSCKAGKSYLLELEPNEADPGLRSFLLLVRTKDYLPTGARVIDVGGNETTITLQKILLNRKIEEGKFAFEIPLGVDVIDRRAVSIRLPVIEEKTLSSVNEGQSEQP